MDSPLEGNSFMHEFRNTMKEILDEKLREVRCEIVADVRSEFRDALHRDDASQSSQEGCKIHPVLTEGRRAITETDDWNHHYFRGYEHSDSLDESEVTRTQTGHRSSHVPFGGVLPVVHVTAMTVHPRHRKQIENSDQTRVQDFGLKDDGSLGDSQASIFKRQGTNFRTHVQNLVSGADPKPGEQNDDVPGFHLSRLAARVVRSSTFEAFLGTLVVLNVVLLGINTHLHAIEKDRVSSWFTVCEYFFCAIFAAEASLRIIASFRSFFFGSDRYLNVLDLLLLVMQIVEIIASSVGTQKDIAALSAFRVLKLVRIIRIARLLRQVQELRTLVTSIIVSLRCLIWTLILLMVLIYVFSLIITQAVTDHSE